MGRDAMPAGPRRGRSGPVPTWSLQMYFPPEIGDTLETQWQYGFYESYKVLSVM